MAFERYRNFAQVLRRRSVPVMSVLLGTLCAGPTAGAQSTGGQYAMEFLRMSNSAHITALGGISVANPDADIALVVQNPAMMRAGLHNQLELTYNGYYANTGVYNLQYGWHAPKINTSFFFGTQYLNYGDITQTNALGQVEGSMRAQDLALTLGASHAYREHWRYGASVKMAQSVYGAANASAALVDVGINYYDTSTLLDFGAVAKNMGVMVSRYNTSEPAEPVPFDLQIGVSKRFKHLPLRLIATVHHLYQWDVRYNDPSDKVSSSLNSSDTSVDNKSYFADKLFRHFIFGAELTLGKKIILSTSYNFLRRKEMALTTSPGTTGFAFGVAVNLNKFRINYGRSYYHISGAYNEISLTMSLNKLMGLGQVGERIKWNSEYPDWE